MLEALYKCGQHTVEVPGDAVFVVAHADGSAFIGDVSKLALDATNDTLDHRPHPFRERVSSSEFVKLSGRHYGKKEEEKRRKRGVKNWGSKL